MDQDPALPLSHWMQSHCSSSLEILEIQSRFRPFFPWSGCTTEPPTFTDTISVSPDLSPIHWTPLHHDTAAEKAPSATSSSLGLTPGLGLPAPAPFSKARRALSIPTSCPSSPSLGLPSQGTELVLAPTYYILPGAAHLSVVPVLLTFPWIGGVTYVSFTTFPDSRNSCVFRASLSIVQSTLNCNLIPIKTVVCMLFLEWNICSLLFSLSKSIWQKSSETINTEE